MGPLIMAGGYAVIYVSVSASWIEGGKDHGSDLFS